MPRGANTPEKILRIVGVEGQTYRTFSHFFSDGKLILGEDYGTQPRSEIDRGHSKVECPRTEGNFSPDGFLKERGNER